MLDVGIGVPGGFGGALGAVGCIELIGEGTAPRALTP